MANDLLTTGMLDALYDDENRKTSTGPVSPAQSDSSIIPVTTPGFEPLPGFGVGDLATEERQTPWEMFGDFIWEGGHHFASASLLGLPEFVAPTTAMEDKSRAGQFGAMLGETLGFFPSMGIVGKGFRAGLTNLRHGSKTITKEATDAAVQKSVKASKEVAELSSQKGFGETVEKSISNTIDEGSNTALLFQHEAGGAVADQANVAIGNFVTGNLVDDIAKAGFKISKEGAEQISKAFTTGLREGKHINSVEGWIHQYTDKWFINSMPPEVQKWMGKYLAGVGQDMAVLGVHGLLRNGIESIAREDREFEPMGVLGHTLMLSLVFPALRSFGSGGERNMRELWSILRSDMKKADYAKMALEKDGPETIRGLLLTLGGGKYPNWLGNRKWTAKSGNSYTHADFRYLDLRKPEVLDDAVGILKQMQDVVGNRFNAGAVWGKEWVKDSVTPGAIFRMAVGGAVMNLDMFKDNAMLFRNLPPEQSLGHLLIGALMSRGKGSWANRGLDKKSGDLNDYYELTTLLGMDHSKISSYLKVMDMRDQVISTHLGLSQNEKVNEIVKIYEKYEKMINIEQKANQSIQTSENSVIDEYLPLRSAVGFVRAVNSKEGEFILPDYSKMSQANRDAMASELKKVMFNDKALHETSYQSFISSFWNEVGPQTADLYTTFLQQLGTPSVEGAGDNIMNIYVREVGGRKVIHYGGVNDLFYNNNGAKSTSPEHLNMLMEKLRKEGLAVYMPNLGQPEITPAGIERADKTLKGLHDSIVRMGLGDKVQMDIDIIDNPWLNSWLGHYQLESQTRLTRIAMGRVGEMEEEERIFHDLARGILSDSKGSFLKPEHIIDIIKQRSTEGMSAEEKAKYTRENEKLLEDIRELSTIFYEGHPFTNSLERGKIKEEDAKALLESFDALGTTVRTDNLGEGYLSLELSKVIASEKYGGFTRDPYSIRALETLNESGLVALDPVNKKILVYSEESLRYEGLGSREIADYNEIISLFPSNMVEKVVGGIIRDKYGEEPAFSAIKDIAKSTPERFATEIKETLKPIVDKLSPTEDGKIIHAVDELMKFAEARDYSSLREGMDSIMKKLSANEKLIEIDNQFNRVIELMKEGERQGQMSERALAEFSEQTRNVVMGLKEVIANEFGSRDKARQYLTKMMYAGESPYGYPIEDPVKASLMISSLHARLSSELNKANREVTLEQLMGEFVNRRSYSDLLNLLRGIRGMYIGTRTRSNLDNADIIDKANRFKNDSPERASRTRMSIAEKFGLLDTELNRIKPKAVQLIRSYRFDEVLKMVPKDLQGDFINEIPRLFWAIKSTIESPTVRYDDGKRLWDFNAESSKTVRNSFLSYINQESGGHVQLFNVKKSGRINNRNVDDISSQENIKIKFEGTDRNRVIDEPDHKSRSVRELNEKIGQAEIADLQDYQMLYDMIPKGSMRYIAVDYGAPILFVENSMSKNALKKVFRSWYEQKLTEYGHNEGLLNNFKGSFQKVTSYEEMLKAMYYDYVNPVGFEYTFLPNVFGTKAASAMYERMLKYAKLGAGDNVRNLNPKELLQMGEAMTNTVFMSGEIVKNYKAFKTLFESNPNGLRTGIYADETGENGLTVRGIFLRQVAKDIKDPNLRDVILKAYTEKEGNEYTGFHSLDSSVIDGAKYIGTDLMKSFLFAESSQRGESNGFKGSIASVGNRKYFMLGKGLFIYDPQIAASMDKRGLQLLMGESTAKEYYGQTVESLNTGIINHIGSRLGDGKKGRVARIDEKGQFDIYSDVAKFSESEMMITPWEAINLRFAGHPSSNALVPHTYTHFQSKGTTERVRAWQKLDSKIAKLKLFSTQLKQDSRQELALVFMERARQEGNWHLENTHGWVQDLLNLGLTTENTLLKKQIIKFFEQESLGDLISPSDPTTNYTFLIPGNKEKSPVFVKLESRTEKGLPIPIDSPEYFKKNQSIQFGESSPGVDMNRIPIRDLNEMTFVYRSGDRDVLVQPKIVKDKVEYEIFNGIDYWADYNMKLKGPAGEVFEKITEVPKEVKSAIDLIRKVIESSEFKNLDGTIKMTKVQEVIEAIYEDIPQIKNTKFALGLVLERGPRKGVDDFTIQRIRVREGSERKESLEDWGPTIRVNPYDTRISLQGDHDGDKVRWSHKADWEFFKEVAIKDGIIPDYPVLSSPDKNLNLFGIGTDKTGKITPAGTEPINSLDAHLMQVSKDQMLVGNVIGVQGPMQWAKDLEFNINGRYIRLGNTGEELLKTADIHQRIGTASQSSADFIAGLNQTMRKNPRDFLFYGEHHDTHFSQGESPYSQRQRIIDLPRGSAERLVFDVVMDVLKEPGKIFNKVYDASGGKAPSSYVIEDMYWQLNKFFMNPNKYVFNELVNRHRTDNESLDKIIKLFFYEGRRDAPKNALELRKEILRGNIKEPLNNPIDMKSFTKKRGKKIMKDIDAYLDVSNAGHIIKEIHNSGMYKMREIDDAWKGVGNIGDFKKYSENLIDTLTLLRSLGSITEEIVDKESFFDTKRIKVVKDLEHRSLVYNILAKEESHLLSKLGYLSGFGKATNSYTVEKVQDRLASISAAKDQLFRMGIEDVAKQQNVTNISQVKTRKFTQKYIKNKSKKWIYLYEVDKNNMVRPDNTPNYNSVSRKPIAVAPGKQVSINPGREYLQLNNPIISHRISKKEAVEGLTYYFSTHGSHSSLFGFDNQTQLNKFHQKITDTGKIIKKAFSTAIENWKRDKSRSDEYFNESSLQIKLALDSYFSDRSILRSEGEVPGLTLEQSKIYHLAKMLMRPLMESRTITSTDIAELPFFKVNENIIREVWKYLSKNKHTEVMEKIIGEYNEISDYLSGKTNESTYALRPSSFYEKDYFMNEGMYSNSTWTLVQGAITPDVQMLLKRKGIGQFEGKSMYGNGEFDIVRMRDMLTKWEVKFLDKRRCN